MQVGVADAARKDLDEGLAGGRCRNRDLLDGEWLAKGADHGRLHRLGPATSSGDPCDGSLQDHALSYGTPPPHACPDAPDTAARCRVACSDKTTPPRHASTRAWNRGSGRGAGRSPRDVIGA